VNVLFILLKNRTKKLIPQYYMKDNQFTKVLHEEWVT